MTIIKDAFVSFFTTVGIISSTAKDSFMEGWKNPYVPVTEKDLEDARTFVDDVREEWSISSQ